MKIKYFLVLLGLVLIVSACKANQFQKLDLDGHYYNVSFGQNIPLKLKQQAVSVFSKDMQSHQNQGRRYCSLKPPPDVHIDRVCGKPPS